MRRDFGSPVFRRGRFVVLWQEPWFFVAEDVPPDEFDVLHQGDSVVEAKKIVEKLWKEKQCQR